MPKRDPFKIYLQTVKHEAAIARALQKMSPALEKKANVAGFGVGHKKKSIRSKPTLAAVLFVTKKVPLSKLKPRDRLPRSLKVGTKRVPTDVVRMPALKPTLRISNRDRRRPVMMGASIQSCAHDQPATPPNRGTAGAIVRDIHDKLLLLSAGHVLDAAGNDVIQPGGVDGGKNAAPPVVGQPTKSRDRIGSVTKIAAGGVDAGVAETQPASEEEIGIGAPRGTYWITVGLPVKKSGATTGVTRGAVAASNVKVFNAVTMSWYNAFPQVFTGDPPTKPLPPIGQAQMSGLFLIAYRGFCAPGDSGSLVMAGDPSDVAAFGEGYFGFTPARATQFGQGMERLALGLLIGGNNLSTAAVAIEIDVVTSALKVDLVI